jgi:hypothetical protein
MWRYSRMLWAALVLALAGCKGDPADDAPGWNLRPPGPDAAAVTANHKLPGQYPAGSRLKDPDARGGFSPCDNYPQDLAGRDWGENGTVALVAFPSEPVAYFKHRGFALRLINRTGEAIPFAACDSMLGLVREARDAGGEWREIETPPQPICGNSFHRMVLGPGQYWEFLAREYAGPVKARMRFRLEPGDGRPTIYSNVFDGRVTRAQIAGG